MPIHVSRQRRDRRERISKLMQSKSMSDPSCVKTSPSELGINKSGNYIIF